jgi:hypothetical protein
MEYITLRAIPFEYTWEEGECHLFQTPPPIEEKKDSTHHHQNLLLKVPHYHQKKKIIKIISFIETPRASH